MKVTVTASSGFIDPTVVQTNAAATCASCSSVIGSFGSNIASGNLIVAVVHVYNGVDQTCPTFNTPTDTRSTSFTQAASKCQGNGVSKSFTVAIYYGQSTAAGSDVVTATITTTFSGMGIEIYEVSAASNIQTSATGGATVGTSFTTSSLTFPSSSFLIAGVTDNVGGCQAGAGFTLIPNSGNAVYCSEYATSGISSPTTFPMSTTGSSDAWAEVGVQFNPSVTQPITCTLANSNPNSITITFSGGSPSPTSGTCSMGGTTTNVIMNPSTLLTITMPTANSTYIWTVTGNATSTSTTSCPSGTCSTFSLTAYATIYKSFQITAKAQSTFDSGLSISSITISNSGAASTCNPTITSGQGSASKKCHVDYGMTATSPEALSGAPTNSRWENSAGASSTTAAIKSSVGAVNTDYYKQWTNQFAYSVSGGGTPTAPTFTANSLGVSTPTTLTTTLAAIWADNAAICTVTNPTTGSTSAERWNTQTSCPTSSAGGGSTTFAYFHQYSVQVSNFFVSDGSALKTAASAFTITCKQFGSSFSITALSTSYWVDATTACSQTSVTWMGIEVAGTGTVTPSAGASMTFNTLVQKDSANQFQFAIATTTLSSVAWDVSTAQLSFAATGSGTRTFKVEEISNTYKVEPGYISIDGTKYQTGSSGWAYSNPIFTFSGIAVGSNTIIVSWAGQVGSSTPSTPPGQQGSGGGGSGTGAVNFFLAIPLSNFSLTAGQTTTLSVPLTWTNTNQIRVTSVYLSGPYSSWVTLVTQLPLLAYMNPATGSNTTLQFTVSIPAGAKPATYEVPITVSATSTSGSLSNLQKTLTFHVAQSLSQGIILGSPDLYLYAAAGVLALIVVVPAVGRR